VDPFSELSDSFDTYSNMSTEPFRHFSLAYFLGR
jgi:hypothetical protein